MAFTRGGPAEWAGTADADEENKMLRTSCRPGGLALLITGLVFIAAPAHGYPLGLSVGDTIQTIEWDALKTDGNGGEFDVASNIFTTTGQFTSVLLTTGPPAIPQSNVDFDFDLNFITEMVQPLAVPFINVSSTLRSPGAMLVGPDVVVIENGNIVLEGQFVGNLTIGGIIDITEEAAVLQAVGVITITGGDPNLVAALGGSGVGEANVFLTAFLDSFNPSLPTLIADNQVWNSDFNVSLSGTVVPLNASAFVPEPSTALLLGAGLIGLLGTSRRIRSRRG